MLQAESQGWDLMMLGISMPRTLSHIPLYRIDTGEMKMSHQYQRQCQRRRIQSESVMNGARHVAQRRHVGARSAIRITIQTGMQQSAKFRAPARTHTFRNDIIDLLICIRHTESTHPDPSQADERVGSRLGLVHTAGMLRPSCALPRSSGVDQERGQGAPASAP